MVSHIWCVALRGGFLVLAYRAIVPKTEWAEGSSDLPLRHEGMWSSAKGRFSKEMG